jgi:hypothetical protein
MYASGMIRLSMARKDLSVNKSYLQLSAYIVLNLKLVRLVLLMAS